ncbi:DUF1996 domain-containing protein [Polymorphospora rubra]|uniref:F5/8 type C domain-containing protein n=1 Tax=Polymorphospora rubra TaxID=338584 RepID=A0A810N704_9ACTN|nr:DUF1996 domain-containing protein [Polymorphospora rubra]BCJ68780.1 hypothetical protein Prubr_58010 [Polymorphospora rubra]
MSSTPAAVRPRHLPRLRRLVAPLAVTALVASALVAGPLNSADAADALLSHGRPAVSSSNQGTGTPASAAFDADVHTRWSSAAADPQWIRVDLGTRSTVTRVELQWEAAYATAYQIQTSDDTFTWNTIYSTTTGTGGNQALNVTGTGRHVRLLGTTRATMHGYSLWEIRVFGSAGGTPPTTPPPGNGYVPANPPVTGVVPSTHRPPNKEHREFQANCAPTHHLPDDPIVFPNLPGASHYHTFMGSPTTNARSTLASLQAGGTSCRVPADRSGYWMPTMYNGNQLVSPAGHQVIYYKSGVIDYTSVRPFPPGLRYVVGSPNATAADFIAGSVEGWECGDSYDNADFPAWCPPGTQLNVRYQSPSCWDGRWLDTPDHKSHMAYPVNGVCPTSHPVAVPMIEFKMAFPVSGDMSQVRLSSGRGYSFHYDFFNVWEPPTLAAMVNHCIRGGLQCDARGFDLYNPQAGAALNENYELP